jgi:hypothetical protein
MMKLQKKLAPVKIWFGLSTHLKTGGVMKPRPLKPLSTQPDKYIFVS